ncbi:lipoprotein VlpC, partial [Sulfolobus sp. A20-N-F6]
PKSPESGSQEATPKSPESGSQKTT